MKTYSFLVADAVLMIDVSSNVTVLPSPDDSIRVEIEGGAEINVTQKGRIVKIKEMLSNSNNTISVGNCSNFQISGSSTVFINGTRIDINSNGKRVDISNINSTDATSITVFAPICDLELWLAGVAEFKSFQSFDEVFADLSGSSKATISVNQSLELDLSGASKVNATINQNQCEIKIDASGASKAIINGNFKVCKADASGASNISTFGICLGDYKAIASGCSTIRHQGEIKGRITEKTSGNSSISL